MAHVVWTSLVVGMDVVAITPDADEATSTTDGRPRLSEIEGYDPLLRPPTAITIGCGVNGDDHTSRCDAGGHRYEAS